MRGNKNKTRPVLHISLLIKYSVQQQIRFNGNVFGNKCCRCNEDSLYLNITEPFTCPWRIFIIWLNVENEQSLRGLIRASTGSEDLHQHAHSHSLIWAFAFSIKNFGVLYRVFRGDLSWNLFYGHSPPYADSKRAVVGSWRKNLHKYILVNSSED